MKRHRGEAPLDKIVHLQSECLSCHLEEEDKAIAEVRRILKPGGWFWNYLTGADEMLTGYYNYFNLYLYEMKDSQRYPIYLKDWNENISKYVRNPFLKRPTLYFDNSEFRGHIYLLNEMFHEGVRVILHEDDLNSMYYSIENRSPYLDKNLFEFTYSIPNEYLIQNGYGKYLLRMVLRGILNDKVCFVRRKKGFNPSISSLIDFTNPEDRERFLDSGPIYRLFDKKKIEKVLDMSMIPNSYSKFIFNFINAKIFFEQQGQSF